MLSWIIATPEVFAEYNRPITDANRRLQDGRALMHAEHSDSLYVLARFDTRLEFATHEALMAYVEYVCGFEE